MKKFRNIFFLILAIGLGFLMAHLSVAQSANQPANKLSDVGQSNLADDDLQLLMDNLDRSGQTNNLKLLFHGLDQSRALQKAADISIITSILQGLRDGKTNEVINYLEGHLDIEIVGFGYDYASLNNSEKKQISLKSFQRAQNYRNKFPNGDVNHPEYYKGVTNAFKLLDENGK